MRRLLPGPDVNGGECALMRVHGPEQSIYLGDQQFGC